MVKTLEALREGTGRYNAARKLAAENRQAEQDAAAFDAAVSSGVHQAADTIEATIDRGERVSSGFLASAAAWFEGVFNALGNLWASPSRPTELEREVAPKVAEERAQDAAIGEAYRQYLADYDDRHTADRQAEQTRDVNRALGYDHDPLEPD